MSSKKALRMLSPKVLEYPVKIFEVNVSENSEAKEGDILVRLSDRNGMPAAIAAPFDCRIGAIDVSVGETLESQSSLLELDRIEEVLAAEIVENEPELAPATAPEAEPAATPEPISEPASKPQSDADRIAALQAKYSKPKPNTRSASTVPKVTPDPSPAANHETAPVSDPVQASPIEESRSQYQSEADRIAELQAKYAGRAHGGQHTHSASSPAPEQSTEDNTGSMELGKHLPFMLLLLIAPPIILFGILWLFGMLPTEMIDPPRRPSIFFLIQHPSIIFATLVGFGVPLLLYLNMPAPSDSKWSGKFRIANIIAGIIGFLATIAVAMTPTNDLLILLGVKDGIFLENATEKRRPAAPRPTTTAQRPAPSQPTTTSKQKTPEAVATQFARQHSWRNSPRITPSVYSSFTTDKFPEFRKIDSFFTIGGHPKGATLIGRNDKFEIYATIYDTGKQGLVLTPQNLGRANLANFVLSPKSKDQTVIGVSNIEIGQKMYGVRDVQLISTTKTPKKIQLNGIIKDRKKIRVLNSHNIQELGARVRYQELDNRRSQVIDVFKGDLVSSISQDQIGISHIRDIYLEKQGPSDFSLSVVGSTEFALFRCTGKGGCGRVQNGSTRYAPGRFSRTPEGYKPMRGLVNSAHDILGVSFQGFSSRSTPDVLFGKIVGGFVGLSEHGFQRVNGKRIPMRSVFLRKGNKMRYFPAGQNGKIRSDLVDIETLPNGAGYAMIIKGEATLNREFSWVVLLDNNLEPRGIWSNPNENYNDIMATKSGQLIVVGTHYYPDTEALRPVFASLPY